MSTTTIQVKLNLTIQDSFLKPHEKEYINELARESAVRLAFLDAFQTWAGAEVRKRMDAREPAPRSDAEDGWRLFGQRKYGGPMDWRPEHENCRCAYAVGKAEPVPMPRINITLPGDTKALAEQVRRTLDTKAQSFVGTFTPRAVRTTTRREAAAADRKARRERADTREAARKTARAQAAHKGHATRAKRAKAAARKRRRAA